MTDTTNTTALGTEAAATEDKKKKSKLRSPMHYPQMFLLHALVIILVVWGLFGVVFGVMSAPNNDMYPRFDSGDLLLLGLLFFLYREGADEDLLASLGLLLIL